MTYFRKNIEEMQGYTPGEQPKTTHASSLQPIKLNTNENPYPPSPEVEKTLKSIDYEKLRLYPNPTADKVRNTIADIYGVKCDNIVVGNGSDDILTVAIRSFVGENQSIACFEPTYSLYPVLAKIQNATTLKIELDENLGFAFPMELTDNTSDLFKSLNKVKLFFITRPNAPTGTVFDITSIDKFCAIFKGIVFIDEAYADFSEDNCLELQKKYSNVIIGRTLSKSYCLAGIRLGWAIADKQVINGMMKVKDSYNINYITQELSVAALLDQNHLNKTVSRIKQSKERLVNNLINLNFSVIPSESNFIFASPPDKKGSQLFEFLRERNIIVRYFPGKITSKYIRITIGKDKNIDKLIECCKNYIKF